MTFEELIKKRTLVVILGPTASGKTAVSIELAKLIDIEVISADSRQVYKLLDIGTATPDENELLAVKHHFINTISPDQYYSAGLFGKQARLVADQILDQGKLPVIVGGSGLYIKALCEGLFAEGKDSENTSQFREELNQRFKTKGVEPLFDQLREVDPESAKRIPDKNPVRVIRALEYYLSNKTSISSDQELKAEKVDFNVIYFGIRNERNTLYHRINHRADQMWYPKDGNVGIIEETKMVLSQGYDEEINSLNTVGYKEAIQFLKSELTEKEALDKMKQNTRRYAKRQITWFKKVNDVNWFEGDSIQLRNQILKHISSI